MLLHNPPPPRDASWLPAAMLGIHLLHEGIFMWPGPQTEVIEVVAPGLSGDSTRTPVTLLQAHLHT